MRCPRDDKFSLDFGADLLNQADFSAVPTSLNPFGKCLQVLRQSDECLHSGVHKARHSLTTLPLSTCDADKQLNPALAHENWRPGAILARHEIKRWRGRRQGKPAW